MSDRGNKLQVVQNEARDLFIRKNADYGDSFATYGPVGILVRIGDKIRRMQSITKTGIRLTQDETLRDSLIDLHNYAGMAIMLLDETRDEQYLAKPTSSFHIDTEILKDVMYGRRVYESEESKKNEIAWSVHTIVCGERLDLESCKTLVSAALDTYTERNVATTYLSVALRLADEGHDILSLDAALRGREDLACISSQPTEASQTKSPSPDENLIVAEAGVGIITYEHNSSEP